MRVSSAVMCHGSLLFAAASATPSVYAATGSPSASIEISADSASSLASYGLSQRLQDAKNTIDKIPSLPLCKRTAINTLLTTCAELKSDFSDHSNSHIEARLDAERGAFAVRMAICQLEGDGVHIPDACRMFLPTAANTERKLFSGMLSSLPFAKPVPRFPDYERDTVLHLPSCRQALHDEGKAQGWQVYLHHLQQAAFNCYAMRGETEKDEEVNLLRALLSTTGDVEAAMRDAKEDFLELFRDLTVKSRQHFVDVFQDSDEHLETVQRFMAEWQSSSEQLKENLENVKVGFQHLHDDLDQASSKIQDNQRQHNELATAQSTHLQQATDQIIEVRELHTYILELVQQSLLQALFSATNETALVVQQVNEASSRFIDFTTNINDLDEQIRDIKEETNMLKDTLDTFTTWLGGNLTSSARSLAVFSAYAVVYTCFFIPLWQRLVSVPWCLFPAVACGGALAFLSTVYEQPHSVIATMLSNPSAADWFGLGGWVLFGVTITAFAAVSTLERRRSQYRSKARIRDTVGEAKMLTFRLPVNDPRVMENRRVTMSKWQV
ncbi:hypothetical protein BAUCODRAFT_347655 [Baudoinia panamericana UAMH 10762]|uniref:Nuclear fusion protein KAR5 n=1 Tax=Baudoinia panamericana (strain UAMH 10762) TaxID=717646 RepID=M2NKP5_BAUPA|nr:uncharacterized protein BAUCODRAFT_347655 [Baudoinia panamericana UAMH 10762]EMC99715.1 hypothetical protein BAUCODRAFT_347655 [Baudoinia panamericana UAMH 10762]